jgi:hypothetical protein
MHVASIVPIAKMHMGIGFLEAHWIGYGKQ